MRPGDRDEGGCAKRPAPENRDPVEGLRDQDVEATSEDFPHSERGDRSKLTDGTIGSGPAGLLPRRTGLGGPTGSQRLLPAGSLEHIANGRRGSAVEQA